MEVYVHAVWSTWDRAPFLTPAVREQVYRCIRRECSLLKTEVIALGGIEDHVHVLLRLPATITIAELVKQMKGSSSHLANHRVLPRGFKWQGGYSAFSVSRRAVPFVKDYILRQEEHHRDGTTFAGAEPECSVREGGLRAFPAANSFAPGVGRPRS
ncbi:IS200/IS605 family transposase [Longimicrobium sp.]|uniref:IS200/IS605 family transposase n=1 Tax=Longimicrobium sp. TaxID=2029185 RepID=UPI002E367D9B|nr:IS200/IS605 family transposase [Longimicrobium sp.]HEX6039712.1 IS200/IS605 family transposase [Longimicrobium sp.]